MTRPGHRRASTSLIFFLGAGLQLLSAAPWACELSTSGIAFGGYDPFVNQVVDSVATINVTCEQTTSYSIALSPGGGTYDARVMTSGLHHLLYNLYTDATRTTVWGDGTGPSSTVSDTQAVGSYTVYGRVPARQNAYVGVYSDTIVITITF